VNIFWQFCDNSNLQRIASLNLPQNEEESSRRIKRAIQGLIVVSPLTWGLGIVLGMLVKATGAVDVPVGTEYLALLTFIRDAALGGSFLAFITVIALAVSMISIMMSTADSAIIAFMQVVLRDLSNVRFFKTSVNVGVTIVTLIVVAALAGLHRLSGWTSIMTVMSGVYSAILVLAFPTILKMNGVDLPKWTVGCAIVAGSLLNWLCTFGPSQLLPPGTLPLNVSLVLPFFGALLGSGVFSILGLLLARSKSAAA
jgi:hypothetical protein